MRSCDFLFPHEKGAKCFTRVSFYLNAGFSQRNKRNKKRVKMSVAGNELKVESFRELCFFVFNDIDGYCYEYAF